jgi:hypothetical protein
MARREDIDDHEGEDSRREQDALGELAAAAVGITTLIA